MPTAPSSPPKRMTRARARAIEDMKKAPAKSAKITTPATKAAAANRAAKRKTRTDDEEDSTLNESGQSRPRDESKKPSSVEMRAPPKPTASKSATSRGVSDERATLNRTTVKATRGQPKNNTDESNPTLSRAKDTLGGVPPVLSTRTRAGSVRSNALPSNRPESKKKVTFQDAESDKENAISVNQSSVSRAVPREPDKQQGLKAKPIRRVTTRTAVSKQTRKSATKSGKEQPKAEPLSPKKNAQVAVGTCKNDGETLETTAPTTPPRELSKSPKKLQVGTAQQTSLLSTSKIVAKGDDALSHEEDLATSGDELQRPTALFTSPTKEKRTLMISSPAKRPAQSPFKETMAGSPMKVASEDGAMSSQKPNPGLVDSVVSKPPKKVPFTEPRKRTAFDESVEPGFKNSLFGSPAKRPLSPFKSSVPGPSPKAPSTTAIVRTMTFSGLQKSPRKVMLSPSKSYTSSLRAAKSPEASAKVHKKTPEEQAMTLRDEIASAASPFLAMKETAQPQGAAGVTQVSTPAGSPKRASLIPIRSPPKTSPCVDHICEVQPLPHPDCDMYESLEHSSGSTEILTAWNHRISDSQHQCSQRVGVYESEDELQVDVQSPALVPSSASKIDNAGKEGTPPMTPPMSSGTADDRTRPSESMTTLAERFGKWKGATPDSVTLEQRRIGRTMFSPLHPIVDGLLDLSTSPSDTSFGEDSCHFSQSIQVHTDEDEIMFDSENEDLNQENAFRQSQVSDASQEYGDENAFPIDPALLEAAKEPVATCTPARVFAENRPKIIHTVHKVPLKPAAEYGESPIPKPARKTHSLSGELSPMAALEVEAFRQIYPSASSVPCIGARKSKFAEHVAYDNDFDTVSNSVEPLTPESKARSWSATATPARTPRANLNPKLLSGAVVFVDVHTTEGADASSIFVELLTQMGARCVKQWNWNSRNSLSGKTASEIDNSGSSKVGITHVVFKDGGKRTMEKVREVDNLVFCVGVGWVLDCERENKWLDEAEYRIDSSTIPRGGHRRRKSMEPKALSSAKFSPTKSSYQEPLSPTKEFLNLSSSPPASQHTTLATPAPRDLDSAFGSTRESPEVSAVATPIPDKSPLMFDSMKSTPEENRFNEGTYGSPSTPYFLHPQDLVQQTCPPKQTQELFFPLSGRIEDQPDEAIRQRLLVARRKSLQWAPRVGSPLSRAHSYQ